MSWEDDFSVFGLGDPEENCLELWRYADDPQQNGFKFKGNHKGIWQFKRKMEDASVLGVLGKTTIPASIEDIQPYITGIEYASDVDNLFKEGEIVVDYGDGVNLIHSRYSSGAPLVVDREFVYLDIMHFEGEDCVSFSKSVEHGLVGLEKFKSGSVWGEILVSGWVARPIGEGQEMIDSDSNDVEDRIVFDGIGDMCEMTWCVQVDPKGWVPTWVVNQVALEQLETLRSLKNVFL